MTAVSPVTAGLRLPYRLHESAPPLSDAQSWAEMAIEIAIAAWLDYREPSMLEAARCAIRRDLTPEQFRDLAVELCEMSIDRDTSKAMGAANAVLMVEADYARHLAGMATPTKHKLSRRWRGGDYLASCTCGWSEQHAESARVSLAIAAHRNEHGLNPAAAL